MKKMKNRLYQTMATFMLAGSLVAAAQSTDNNMKQDQMQQDQMKHDEMDHGQMRKDDAKKEKKAKKTKKSKMKKDDMKKDGGNMSHDDGMKNDSQMK